MKVTVATGDSYVVRLTQNGTVAEVVPASPSNEGSPVVYSIRGDTYLVPTGVVLGKFGVQFFDLSEMIRDNATSGLRAIVQLRQNASASSLEQMIMSDVIAAPAGAGADQDGLRTGELNFGQSHYLTVSASKTYEKSLFAFLNGNPAVEKVYPDSVVRPTALPVDNGGNYYSGAVQALQKYSTTGRGIKIAILDTGIYQLPDFQYPNGTSKIIFTENLSDDNGTNDYYGHGTHVAGIAAGSGMASGGAFVGVAPDAELMNVKVIDRFGSGFASWIIQGIQDAVAHGANVISMSLGGFSNLPLDEAVNWAASQGVLVVVAAGNSGPYYTSVGSPGEAAGAITVGAAAEPNWSGAPPTGGVTQFSSLGPEATNLSIKPDIVAPGWQIISDRAPGSVLSAYYPPYPGYNDSYMQLSGTSMATPFVSGALALIKQAHPGWSNSEMVASLESTATILGSTWNGVPQMSPFVQGGGLMNVSAAVNPPLLFTPAIVDIGSLYSRGSTTTVKLLNPTSKLVQADLSVAALDINNAVDASAFVRLNQTRVSLAPFATKAVQLTVLTSELSSSIFGGYIVATNSTSGRPLAHAAVSFFALHFAKATFLNPDGTPMANALALQGYYRNTFLEFSESKGLITDSQGSLTVPMLGDDALFMSFDFLNSTYYLEGTANQSPANQSIMIRASDALPVILKTQKDVSFMGTLSGLITDVFVRNIGSYPPIYYGSRFTLSVLYSNSILRKNSTVYFSPNTLNDHLVLRYAYTLSGEVSTNSSTLIETLTGNDLYLIQDDQYNLTRPYTYVVQQGALAKVVTSVLSSPGISSLNLVYGTNVYLTTLGGYFSSNFTLGLGLFTAQISTGKTMQVHMSPNRAYWVWLEQGFSIYQAGGDIFAGTLISPAAGTTTFDRFNAQPFYRPDDVFVFSAYTAHPEVLSYYGMIQSGSSPLEARHQVAVGNCSQQFVVNGSLYYASQTPAVFCGTFSPIAFISGSSKLQFLSTFNYPGALSTTVTENKTMSITGQSAGLPFTSLAGTTVSDFEPIGLSLNNTVPGGNVHSQFRVTFSHYYASSIQDVSVFYSLDKGASWNPASAQLVSEVPVVNPCNGNQIIEDCQYLGYAYNNTGGLVSYAFGTTFPQIGPGQYVSVKIAVRDASGGVTTWLAKNAILTSGFTPPQHIVTFTAKGLLNGTRWAVQVDGPTYSVVNSSDSDKVTFAEPNGNYTYSLIPPTGNGTARFLVSNEQGVVSVSGRDVNMNVGIQAQFRLAFGYSLVGDWRFHVKANLSVTSSGRTLLAPLNRTGNWVWLDAGSTWNASSVVFHPPNKTERLGAAPYHGVVSAPGNITVTYYVQYSLLGSYTIAGGGSPPPPTLLSKEFGSRFHAQLGQTNRTYWLDQGSTWSVNGSIPGSLATERWYTASPVGGKLTSPVVVHVLYYHQYLVRFGFYALYGTLNGTLAVSSHSLGIPVRIRATGAGNQSWVDAGSSYSYPSLIPGVTLWERWAASPDASGIIAGGTTVAPAFFKQYYVRLAVNDASGGRVSPQSGWYNATGRLAISETPADGWQFEGWVGGSGSSYGGSNSSTVLNLLSPVNETAVFFPGFTVTDNPGGSVAILWGSHDATLTDGKTLTIYVPVNSSVSLVATPSIFYIFTGWRGAVNGTSADVLPVVQSPADITATFGYNFPLIASVVALVAIAAAVSVLLIWKRDRAKGRGWANRLATSKAEAG